MTGGEIILFLLGFIQAVVLFVLKMIFNKFDKLDDKIDANSTKDEADNNALRKEMISLLDRHYVTTGQLSTLEEKLMGEIKGMTVAVNNLVELLKAKEK